MIGHLTIVDLTNDVIGGDADQAQDRAFSTNVLPASKVFENLSNFIYKF